MEFTGKRRRAVSLGLAGLTLLAVTPARGGTPHRVLPQAVLTLSPPQLASPLLSGQRVAARPIVRYHGTGVLSYELLEGPEGMTLDSASGRLFWTPTAAAEGASTTVRMRASDGQATAETTFAIQVVATSALASTLAGSTLTVTQGSLQGVAWTFPGQTSRPPAELAAAILPPGQAPPLPPNVTRVSDFFRVTPVEASDGSTITVALPKRLVPNGRASGELRMYVFTDRVEGARGPVWVCTWRERDVLPGGTATIKVKELGELSFIGLSSTTLSAAPGGASDHAPRVGSLGVRVGARDVTFTCEQKLLADGTLDPSTEHCAVASDPPFEVWIKDLPRQRWLPRATVTDLVSWLLAARVKFATLHLSSEPVIEVVVEDIPEPGTLGFVAGVEDQWTVHLDDEERRLDVMQCSAVHEYFHHAQSRTRIAGLDNLLADGDFRRSWLTEGTARWFEDEVYDALDSYREKNGEPLPNVLLLGLGESEGVLPSQDKWLDPYDRFAFFKMLYNRCPGFNLPAILNANLADDPSAIKRLGLAVGGWHCDFEAGFGTYPSMRGNLPSAMLLYLWATQVKNDISLLDPDEKPYAFEKGPLGLIPGEACVDASHCPITAHVPGQQWRGAAYACRVGAVDPLPADHEAVIEFDGGDGTSAPWIWLGSPEADLANAVARQFQRGTLHWGVGPQPRSPEMVAIVVNPSLVSVTPSDLRAKLLGRAPKATALDLDVEYPDGGLKLPPEVLRWHLTAHLTVTGPEGMQITQVGVPHQWQTATYLVTVKSSGLTPPYSVALTGTLEVIPIPAAGQYQPPGATLTRHWSFGDKRYWSWCRGEGMSDSPGVALTFSAAAGAEQFYGGPCVEYGQATWDTDEQGNVSNNWGFSPTTRGAIVLNVNPY